MQLIRYAEQIKYKEIFKRDDRYKINRFRF